MDYLFLVIREPSILRAGVRSAGIAAVLCLSSASARADIPLTDPAKTNGWEVSTSGRVDAYLSWVFGETVNSQGRGNLVDPNSGSIDRYILVGPQIGIRGNATPSGATADILNDTKLSAPRIRGGFASTILGFNVMKQITPDLKLTIKTQLWAGIQNGLTKDSSPYRPYNDSASVDWREQWMQLDGSWGFVWGGRRIGLYNRGGMRMDWLLMHQHGVGHPCDVDSSSSATCGHTGTGSMFPARHAQIGYATPDLAGLQLNVAMLDPAMIDGNWNRTPLPRFEAELTFHRGSADKDEVNAWANGLTQVIGRVNELAPNPAMGVPGIPADATKNVWGVGGGAWFRVSGVALGGTGWFGQGLGTAWAFGNTAVDDIGTLRTHFGYLGILSYRAGDFEVAGSYGSANVRETNWDSSPQNPVKISVIKEVRGIGGSIAYHVGPVTFSIDGMNIQNTWHRGEVQHANVVSAGMLAEW
jgi:hypothetical protein